MKKVFHRILLAINIVLGLSLLLSYSAVHINPDDFAMPAYFGLAYPYLLLANIIIVIAWAMLLRLEAFISLAIIILGFQHFLNYIQLFKTKGDKEDTFRVMSYNVGMFNHFEGREGTSRKQIFDLIKSTSPEIVCLQEYFFQGSTSQIASSVVSAIGVNYNTHIRVIGSGRRNYYGIITLTKYPIVRKGEIVHPSSASLTTFTDVIIRNDTFRIYNNHLQSFRLKKMERSFFDEMSSKDDKETISEVKNLFGRLRKGFVSRAVQAQNVKEHIRNSPYPVIVAGDFNDTPVSYAYRKIRKGLNDSFVNSGYGAGFTYRGNYPANRIDYILYDDNLVNSYFQTVRVRYSDHYPVISYFRKKKGAS